MISSGFLGSLGLRKSKSMQPWKQMIPSLMTLSIVMILLLNYEENNDDDYVRNLLEEDDDSEELEEYSISLLPLRGSDYIGFSCAALGLMIAAGGGIGGGGILVPIYILVMGFPAKYAIPLSNITVFGGAVANTILNTPKRHPLADRPLVDWDLILIMEPTTIAGALLGVMMNKVLPDTIIVVALILLLSFTSYKSFHKGIKLYKTETEQIQQGQQQARLLNDSISSNSVQQRRRPNNERNNKNNSYIQLTNLNKSSSSYSGGQVVIEMDDDPLEVMADGDNDEDERFVDEDDESIDDSNGNYIPLDLETAKAPKITNNNKNNKNSTSSSIVRTYEEETALQKILENERRVPKENVVMLIALFVVVLFINLMKGGGAYVSPLGIQCGSLSFWAANVFIICSVLLVNQFARNYLLQRYYLKRKVKYEYIVGDIQWNPRATIVYPLWCTMAGFFAGMFGIGGGIIKGPLMLAMGVHPAVSSASSACMILFTSFSATTSFIVFGLLQKNYAWVCLTLGFTATIAGQLGLSYLMSKSKTKRNSFIVFSIGTVVFLSAILMTIESVIQIMNSTTTKEGEDTTYKSDGICGISSH